MCQCTLPGGGEVGGAGAEQSSKIVEIGVERVSRRIDNGGVDNSKCDPYNPRAVSYVGFPSLQGTGCLEPATARRYLRLSFCSDAGSTHQIRGCKTLADQPHRPPLVTTGVRVRARTCCKCTEASDRPRKSDKRANHNQIPGNGNAIRPGGIMRHRESLAVFATSHAVWALTARLTSLSRDRRQTGTPRLFNS